MCLELRRHSDLVVDQSQFQKQRKVEKLDQKMFEEKKLFLSLVPEPEMG